MQDEVDVQSQVSKPSRVRCSWERNPWLPLSGPLQEPPWLSLLIPISNQPLRVLLRCHSKGRKPTRLLPDPGCTAHQMSIHEEQLSPNPQACFLRHK